MNKQVLYIHGAGSGGYEADKPLVKSLEAELGEDYDVHYPEMVWDESSPDMGWVAQIGKEIDAVKGKVILAGHSFGGSMLLKYLSENKVRKQISGIFLIASPFWMGDEDWKQGFKLRENFADSLPENVPVFLYHCRDDEEVPLNHLSRYKKKLPAATVRKIATGGHEFNNDLTIVAKDIKKL